MANLPKCAKQPCGSCPYRKDVPSGVWAPEEYAKLRAYDAPTWAQPTAPFDCHQRDGCLCAGWVACHGPHELLALRFPGAADPSVYDYKSPIPVFESGAAAAKHGMRAVKRPSKKARALVRKLTPVVEKRKVKR